MTAGASVKIKYGLLGLLDGSNVQRHYQKNYGTLVYFATAMTYSFNKKTLRYCCSLYHNDTKDSSVTGGHLLTRYTPKLLYSCKRNGDFIFGTLTNSRVIPLTVLHIHSISISMWTPDHNHNAHVCLLNSRLPGKAFH